MLLRGAHNKAVISIVGEDIEERTISDTQVSEANPSSDRQVDSADELKSKLQLDSLECELNNDQKDMKEVCLSPSMRHSQRIDEEVDQLLIDIRRIGTSGKPFVLFGDLFDDEKVVQYYEALLGTLKAAKRKGYIDFKGQILLKGMHDKVKVCITKDGDIKSPDKMPKKEERNRKSEEIEQLLSDISRIKVPGETFVLFGDLVNDEKVMQNSHSLVFTLKAAKKQGFISFKGQMLMKGMHDKVKIQITSEVSEEAVCKPFSRSDSKRIDKEVDRLLVDIRRVGTSGEPFVLFGELFDDEIVVQNYEALLGTLKAAKRKKCIQFKGDLLLKGTHDNVMIRITKE